VAASHVLSAMQVEDGLSRSAIRMSLGRESTLEEVLALADAWAGAAVKHDVPAPGAVMA
jgi:cysteine desulfurase